MTQPNVQNPPAAPVAAPTSLPNGVDVARLAANMDAIRADASLAPFHFRATNRWILGGHNRSTIQNFWGVGREDTSRVRPFVMDADEPDVLLGGDQGANPVEYVLHALAGCVTTTLVYYAAAMGIRVESLESSLEGDIDIRGLLGLPGAARSGYQAIRMAFRIRSDASDEQLAELLRMHRRSPVFDTIRHPVPVEVTLDRADAAGAAGAAA